MRNGLSKKLGLSLAAFGLVATSLFTAQTAEAVPAFARQTGSACNSCHFMSFPALNAMGRDFRSKGYTAAGAQGSIEGEESMNLPENLNMSAILKVQHRKANGDSKAEEDYGVVLWPDEAALLVGGRASENMGFLWELGLWEDASELLSSKMHFLAAEAGDIQLSVIPFSTDALGAAYSFEMLNTGAQRSQRPIEDRKGFSATQYSGLDGSATGIALVATTDSWFVNFSLLGAAHGPNAGGEDLMAFGHFEANPGAMANYLRVGYIADMGDLEVAAGMQSWSGTAKLGMGGSEYTIEQSASVIDVQVQGDLAGMPFGFYFSTGGVADAAEPADALTVNAFADYDIADSTSSMTTKSATGLLAKVELSPAFEVYFAQRSGTKTTFARDTAVSTAKSDNSTTLGLQYHVAQNVKLELWQNGFSGDAVGTGSATSKLSMMLFVGM